MIKNLEPNTWSTPSNPREGVDIRFAGGGLELSEVWTMAGWVIQFAHLPAHTELALDTNLGQHFVKVITGALVHPTRSAFADPKLVRSTLVTSDRIVAGETGTLIALFIKTDAAPALIEDMAQLSLSGSNAEAFQWRSFDERFGAHTQAFADADAYMSGGFHLLDAQDVEITYLNLWTAGKGVNLTTHNHGHAPHPLAPAFAEVHWVFYNGTGNGGMYSADSAQGQKTHQYPMQQGDEHGPFFAIDQTSNQPRIKENGAVEYPWHGWEAGKDTKPGQAYDLVAAFETNPAYVQR